MSYLLLLLLALAAAQHPPVSTCLSACIACKPLSPLHCLPLLNATSGVESACLPFYEGPNCTRTTFAYYVPAPPRRTSTTRRGPSSTGRSPPLPRQSSATCWKP